MTSRSSATQPWRSACPPARKFKVDDLFAFKRGRGDLLVSLLMLLLVLFLAAHFPDQSGWAQRDLPQARLGRLLKQPWVGPALALAILLPAALVNLAQSLRRSRQLKRQRQPNRTGYEVEQWLRALEFVGYFLLYTQLMPWLGYLLSTLLLALFLTWRLGYRSRRWLAISGVTALTLVLFFRTLLQIKTPSNIWLYNELPPALASFMKTYF